MYIDGAWCDAHGRARRWRSSTRPTSRSWPRSPTAAGRRPSGRSRRRRGRSRPGGRSRSTTAAKILKKTAELMRERADAIARTLTQEQGKPLAEAKTEVLHAADTFEWFAEEGKRAYGRIIPPANVAKRHYAIKHPVGVVGTITPWNFPAALPSRKIAPALAAGCTVVSRPADQTPLTLIQMFECLADAGLPAGRRQPGDRAAAGRSPTPSSSTRRCARSASPGSTEVGKELIRRSADQVKRLSLELGGHAPLIVFPDADVAAGRPGGRHRQVPQQRPGLHRPVAVLRPREDRQGVHRGGRRADQEAQDGQRAGGGRPGRPDVRGQGARQDRRAGRGRPRPRGARS